MFQQARLASSPNSACAAVTLPLQVVCAVGAAESELGDVSAPRRIDGEGATRLVEVRPALSCACPVQTRKQGLHDGCCYHSLEL